MTKRTAFLSDLHWGDGSAADVFDVGTRRPRFGKLLDYFQDLHARLVIPGDLGECLVANSNAIIEHYRREFDRLARMEVVYVPGNHDAAWGGPRYCRPQHPFFDNVSPSFIETIADLKFLFGHGQQGDPYCNRPYPDADALTALISARRRRRHAKALAAGRNYVDLAPTLLEKAGSLVRRILGRPSRLDETIDAIEAWRQQLGADVICWGHTHAAGRIGPKLRGWHYNSGCLCGEEGAETFGLIDNDTGDVQLYRWTMDCEAVECDTELRAYV